MHPIIKHGAAFAGALEVCEQFDAPKAAAGALITEQSTLDALKNRDITKISAVTKRNSEKDWDGLTPEQEREKEDEFLSRRRQEQALAEAEYERTMEEVREKADLLMAQLEDQRRECLEKLAEVRARPIMLPDGRLVRIGANGEPIDDATGQALEGNDKTEAQRQQKEKEAEEKQWKDRLREIDNAEKHVQKAKDLASQNDENLSPEEMKQREAEAQRELAIAAAKAKGIPDLDAGGPDADIGAALGLDTPETGRTTSFAATLDEKDSRATGLQDHFTGAAQPDTPPPPAPANNPALAVTTSKQISQPNQ